MVAQPSIWSTDGNSIFDWTVCTTYKSSSYMSSLLLLDIFCLVIFFFFTVKLLLCCVIFFVLFYNLFFVFQFRCFLICFGSCFWGPFKLKVQDTKYDKEIPASQHWVWALVQCGLGLVSEPFNASGFIHIPFLGDDARNSLWSHSTALF